MSLTFFLRTESDAIMLSCFAFGRSLMEKRMSNQSGRNRIAVIFSLLILLTLAQTRVLAQSTTTTEQPSTPIYTRPTVLTRPAPQPATAQPFPNSPTIAQPARPDIAPPKPVIITQGLLVETLDGKTVMAQDADQGYNPASAVKLGTALTALKSLGVDYRFPTAVWTNGTLDQTTGTLTGDLIFSGRDPSFHYEHAIMIARELNKRGIRTVTGNLIVSLGFTMNFDGATERS